MYPNLFVIGAAKCGTSALHYYLSLHPELHMSREKEPHFFSRSEDGRWPPTRRFSAAEYERLFESDRPVRGESSVTYSFWPYPAGVPEAIHAVAPEARFVYVVRDPVERSIGHYLHRIGLGTETRSIEAVMREPREHEERYLAASSYATQAEQYLRVFGEGRLHVVEQRDLRDRREDVLRDVFVFLGVDATYTSPRFAVEVNPTTNQRTFTPAGSKVADSRAYKAATGWIRPDVRQRLIAPVRNVLSRPVQRPEIGDDVRTYFAERLAPEAERFRALTGRDFEHWSV